MRWKSEAKVECCDVKGRERESLSPDDQVSDRHPSDQNKWGLKRPIKLERASASGGPRLAGRFQDLQKCHRK